MPTVESKTISAKRPVTQAGAPGGPPQDADLAEALRRITEERDQLARDLAALRAEQPLLAALDSLSEAMVVYDAEGRLVACNENFRRLYGYSEAEARVGVHFSELGRIDVSPSGTSSGMGRPTSRVRRSIAASSKDLSSSS